MCSGNNFIYHISKEYIVFQYIIGTKKEAESKNANAEKISKTMEGEGRIQKNEDKKSQETIMTKQNEAKN